MKKGYPASEYYGPPPPVLNEGGVAKPIAGADPSRVESGVAKPIAGADPSRAERRDTLKESFINKINFVTDFWRQVEDPEVANLSLDKFRERLLEINSALETIVPGALKIQKECVELREKVLSFTTDLELEDEKRRNEKANYKGSQRYSFLQDEMIKTQELLDLKLENNDAAFIASFTNFADEIILKKEETQPFREALGKEDPLIKGMIFYRALKACHFEASAGRKSSYLVSETPSIREMAKLLYNKVLNGENIFDFVKINPYDICFYLDKKEFEENFKGDEFKEISGFRGFHVINSPFIFIFKGDDEDENRRIEIHEQGHNLIGGEGSNLGIHNVVYSRRFLKGLTQKSNKYEEALDSQNGGEEEAEAEIRNYVRGVIKNLNAEISADAKNIVKGYPKPFLNHLNTLILDLRKKTDDECCESREKNFGDTRSKFCRIIKEEIESLINEATDLSTRIITYAYLARKHGFEDEFCSILVLMPTADKYLKRFFEIKLGEDFDLEKINKEIDPVEISVDMPKWFKEQASQYFGPSSTFK